jgi:hypothetical protein
VGAEGRKGTSHKQDDHHYESEQEALILLQKGFDYLEHAASTFFPALFIADPGI